MLEKINRSEALRYLGYKGSTPDERTLDILADCERSLLEAAVAKYLYRRFELSFNENGIEVCGTGINLTGKSISAHLDGCRSVVLMCATISSGVDRLIRRYQATDMTRAVITDALASAAIEQVCDVADEEINRRFPDEYKTWRFSPGYGDLPLDLQRDFLRVLNAQKMIGLTLGKSTILIPTKSVTALIGISKDELPKRKRGCAGCTMRATCKFRKAGERCV
ncbi:methionine synthase [Ruminococcus sp. zg-924]|nr:methionine synthase [Ruminococcus sp. zg-924]MCQ4115526.1 methionine synthase [Ruminococcus sp. zg-921]